MVSLLLLRHSGVLNALDRDAVYAASVELNIARTKHEHPFSSTRKGIRLHAFSCAIRNLLLR